MFSQRENKELFEMAKSYAYTYMEKINNCPVFPPAKSIQ
jgi:hypothetical protein